MNDSATISGMAKTEQVRIPVDLREDVRIVAAASGRSVTKYVEHVLRAAVARDMPKAAKVVAKKAQQAQQGDKSEEPPTEAD